VENRSIPGAVTRWLMLTLLTGPDGTSDADPYLADHTHLNQVGHTLVAQALPISDSTDRAEQDNGREIGRPQGVP
jgi:hypothetical protein